MKNLIFLLLAWSFPAFLLAQEAITIHFDNGEQLLADKAYISNFSSNYHPYILLDKKEGPYYSIDEIESMQGHDKKGRDRYVIPVNHEGKAIFAQRLYQSEKLSVYYTGIIDFRANFDQVNRHYRYSFNHSDLKIININNLQSDLFDNHISMEYLKKAKKVRTIQNTLYVIGAGLLAHGLLSMTDEVEESASLNRIPTFPASFIAGAIVANIPWFLKGKKRKHMINALKAY